MESDIMRFVFLFHALFLATLLTLAHGILRWVAAQKGRGYLDTLLEHWWVVGIALALFGFIFLYYIFALREVEISVLYPIYTGLSIIFVFMMGVLFFSENTTTVQVAGCALIALGIYMVAGARS